MGAHNDNPSSIRNTREVKGRIYVNGANPIDATANIGAGDFTWTRTGVGTATLKINIPAKRVIDIQYSLSKQAVSARWLQLLGETQGTDGMWTFSFTHTDAAAAAQEFAAAHAAAFVSFSVTLGFGDSSV
jgi:hypothetical protein